jgi:hypothetical protein
MQVSVGGIAPPGCTVVLRNVKLAVLTVCSGKGM